MRRVLSIILACFLVSFAYAQEIKVGAIIERYDASFNMVSQTAGTYKVNMRVSVMSKDAADEAIFLAYQDGFKTLSSFSGTLESGGKVIKKYKMADLKTVSVGEGGITDATVSYLEPVAPVPYVVEYTYEISYKNGFITFPSFIPTTEPDVILSAASYTLTVPPGTELMYKSSMEPEKESGAKADVYTWKAPTFPGYVPFCGISVKLLPVFHGGIQGRWLKLRLSALSHNGAGWMGSRSVLLFPRAVPDVRAVVRRRRREDDSAVGGHKGA